MAAIAEWFSIYGMMFDFVRERYGQAALLDYYQALSNRLYALLGEPKGEAALVALAEHFSKTIAADGGISETHIADATLTVAVKKCPDRAYFASNPYPTHRFGDAYCAHCAAVHRSLSERCGMAFQHEAPSCQDQAHACSFRFVAEGRGTP